jgi:DNA-binding transcriptional LysR family regulator
VLANVHKLAWDDLRFVLAIAEHGSLARAARALGVNHTTVWRRVSEVEDRLGVRLFDRLPTGYSVTAAGEQLADVARGMRDSVTDIERRLAGQDLRLTGTVRVTTTDTLAQSLVPSALAAITAQHPDVQLELTTTTAMVSLTKRDADIAVRPTARPPENLVGRRVTAIAFALYASPSYLSRVPAKRDLARHTWLGPDDSLASTTIARWMARTIPDARVALRADTLTALAHAAAAGLGVVALPCYLGDASPALHRVRGAISDMATELWVLTHEDLRATARIRAVIDALVAALGQQRDLCEGRRPLA